MRRFFVKEFRGIAWVLLLATMLTFSAPWWWVGELASHFAFQYAWSAMLLAVGLLLVNEKKMAVMMLLCGVWHVSPVLSYLHNASSGKWKEDSLTIVQFNVLKDNGQTEQIIAWLEENQHFDIVLLQEVTPAFAERLRFLKGEYPYQLLDPNKQGFLGNALISRHPLEKTKIMPFKAGWNQALHAEIIFGKTKEKLVIFGVHAIPPLGKRQKALRDEQLHEVAEWVSGHPAKHKLMMGDFNLTPFSPSFHRLLTRSGLKNSLEGKGWQPTWPSFFPLSWLQIPIDHILTSPSINIHERYIGPSLGSDHFPVITTLSLQETGF